MMQIRGSGENMGNREAVVFTAKTQEHEKDNLVSRTITPVWRH